VTITGPFHPSKRDAYNVENFSKYEDMVKKVMERQPTRAITVFIDIKDIDRTAKKAQVCAACFKGY
jgi:ACT domain-containing protein